MNQGDDADDHVDNDDDDNDPETILGDNTLQESEGCVEQVRRGKKESGRKVTTIPTSKKIITVTVRPFDVEEEL